MVGSTPTVRQPYRSRNLRSSVPSFAPMSTTRSAGFDGELGGEVGEVVVQLAAVAGRVRVVRGEHLGRVDDHGQLDERAVVAAEQLAAGSASPTRPASRRGACCTSGGWPQGQGRRSRRTLSQPAARNDGAGAHAATGSWALYHSKVGRSPSEQRPGRPVAEPLELPGVGPPARRGPCRQFARHHLDGAANSGGHQFARAHRSCTPRPCCRGGRRCGPRPARQRPSARRRSRRCSRTTGSPGRSPGSGTGSPPPAAQPSRRANWGMTWSHPIIRAVDVVGPDHDRPAEDAGLAVRERGELRRDLPAPVAVAGVGDVGDRQRHRLVRRVIRGRRVLVGLRRRHQHQLGPVGVQLGRPGARS